MNDILKDTFTLSQLKSRIRALKGSFLKKFFGGEIPNTALDLNWISSLPPSFNQQFTKDNVYRIFDELEAQISKLPILTIYLTFEPDEATTYQIGSFARKTFRNTLLLDIKLDPALLAGCALVWNGVYKDFSLRAKLQENRVKILDNFKKFLR